MITRVLIADDEDHICQELDYLLGQEKNVEVVAICSSGDEALENICQLKPDVVFLDIDMPGLDGIKLGNCLKNLKNCPYIIYVTAYDKFAVEAFKVGAKGYILKPFSDKDVKEQLAAAVTYLDEKGMQRSGQAPQTAAPFSRVVGELNGKMKLLDQEELLMVYAKNRSVYLRANGKDYQTSFSLSEFENKLHPGMFFRCHRNYIINLYKIKEVVPWFNGTYLLIMDDPEKTEIPVSRNNVKSFKELLGI